MANELRTTGPERERSRGFMVGQFLFLIALAVGVWFLAQSMVEHRFFRGGRIDRHGTLRP
ncbi:MAG: hypothetical protein ABR976_16315 [Terracidiphilus sp.]